MAHSDWNRRQFLTYMGMGSLGLMKSLSAIPATFPLKRMRPSGPGRFRPIQASSDDQLLLPKGFRYDIVARYGAPLGSQGPFGAEVFGYDNDFIAYFPIDALSGGKNAHEGLLWVNHEYIHPLFVAGWTSGEKTAQQIQAEKLGLGGSIIHVKREGKEWKMIKGSKYNRRFTALYPEIELSGPGREWGPKSIGTLANCSGGMTLWNTALSCEENFHEFNPPEKTFMTGFGWGASPETKINEDHYGYVVEVDPFGELPPMKHTALGKFAHENCAVTLSANKRLVVYMGDDAKDQYLYKFVSLEKWNPKNTRAEQRLLLTRGTLYVADFNAGRWLALDPEKSPQLAKEGFTPAKIALETRLAAKLLGATPLDRPEDCEIHPKDGSLYVSLTNNNSHGNLYGQIVRLVETGDDAASESFRYEIFLAGGPSSGLCCPDNLAFDKKGNLWVACDISTSSIGKGVYESFKNNGFFMVPTEGAGAGFAYQFASAPNEAEMTGPCFNPTEDTLFLSIQHPGEMTRSMDKMTSHWPMGGTAAPLPSVVAIQGFKGI